MGHTDGTRIVLTEPEKYFDRRTGRIRGAAWERVEKHDVRVNRHDDVNDCESADGVYARPLSVLRQRRDLTRGVGAKRAHRIDSHQKWALPSEFPFPK